ncbi:hypothetical protein [Glycomyces buryatensis]|uniref:Uncharacterized protein n=1 Tax=Glycomyces buryatensis TaxID=2570927 RepID=A0A4S8Q9I2_9ACTN|nr:hypothetical protein [Glycomyces buryatensis]THV40890.1 hypothetical protein FAB82_13635 [Glycomyces buryatensis]
MGYRYSSAFIKKWEGRLVGILCGGVAAAFVLAGGGLMVAEALELEEFGSTASWIVAGVMVLGLAIGVLSVVGVIVAGAVLGGLSLHRRGWIPGLLLALWLFGGFALYPVMEVGWAFALHLLGFAPMIAAFFWMGSKAKVPMYLASGTPGSPRLYLSEGEGDFSGTGKEMDRDRGDTSI